MAPPSGSQPFAVPRLRHLAAGTPLFRNHAKAYGGNAFNPCLGPPSRFAPLYGPDGACIPSLYLGTDFDGAAYETIFRGPVGPLSTIPRHLLDDRAVSLVRPVTDLSLIPLFTPEATALGLSAAEIFAPSTRAYAACRSLATSLWEANPAAQGLIWSSVRDSRSMAILLFGDRVTADILTLVETRTLDSDPSLLIDFVETAARAGYRIAR